MKLQEASLQLSEQDYRDLEQLSYSALQKYDREGYECVATLFEPFTTPSLVFGSVVDCLLTQGEDAFNEQYAVVQIPALSEAMTNILHDLSDTHSEMSFALISDEDIVQAANNASFYKNWKDATRVQKIREAISETYNYLKANQGKELIAVDDYEDAKKAVEALKSNKLTQKFFSTDDPFGTLEHLYQLQFTSEKHGYKGMLDLVCIDHVNKTIHPCDLKTTKSIYTFEESFYKYRYYLQAAMYTELLKEVIATKCPELQDYTIQPYKFIVIDRNNFKPVVFEWEPTDKVVDPYGKERKSWQELLEELGWALTHQEEKLPKQWYEELEDKSHITLKHY